DLARRAVAALEAVMIHEGSLHGVERTGRAQTLDGDDVVVLMHDRKGQAGIDPPAVDQHSAGAALPVVAALLGAGEVEVLAEGVEQRGTEVYLETPCLAVDGQPDFGGGRFRGPGLDCGRNAH